MKTVLIGTGQIAQQHLACLRTLPEVDLAGVCDLSRTMAESTAERFGVDAWFTDHRAMLDAVRPDVVHVTTPPQSHFRLAMDALAAGAHVIVEKPITAVHHDLAVLLRSASQQDRVLVEDYNYLFNAPVQQISSWLQSGDIGEVIHVEVTIGLDLLSAGSPFADRNIPHPCLSMPGGAIADFLPHLASLAHHFVGARRAVRSHWSKRTVESPLPHDEFRALVDAERGTATLGFSSHTQPEMFCLRVQGSRMCASADLFDMNTVRNHLDDSPRPIARLRNRLKEARDVRRTALRGLFQKLSTGPGTYDGLWSLLARTYKALRSGTEPPISARQIVEVNDLVAALTAEEFRI
jgi:predicted dehydrogenase